jgi:flagellar protein FlaG
LSHALHKVYPMTEITSVSKQPSNAGEATASALAAQKIRALSERKPIESPVKCPPPVEKIDAITVDPVEMRERLDDAIKSLTESLKSKQNGLSFAVDEVSGRSVVTVKSKQTGEVIRQIPGEVVLRVASSIEALKGILFDDMF